MKDDFRRIKVENKTVKGLIEILKTLPENYEITPNGIVNWEICVFDDIQYATMEDSCWVDSVDPSVN